jgi:hypothetical protein
LAQASHWYLLAVFVRLFVLSLMCAVVDVGIKARPWFAVAALAVSMGVRVPASSSLLLLIFGDYLLTSTHAQVLLQHEVQTPNAIVSTMMGIRTAELLDEAGSVGAM